MALTKVSNSMLVQPVNHNILINPSFTVNQRGDVIVAGNSTDFPFVSDRWTHRPANSVGSGYQVEPVTINGQGNGLNIIYGSPTSGAVFLQQDVEAINVYPLYAKQVTVSFNINNNSGIDPLANTAIDVNIWKKDQSAITCTPVGDVVNIGGTRYSQTFEVGTMSDANIPDPSERGMRLRIHPTLNGGLREWKLWNVKLEVGSVATPFIARQYGEELLLCQRYFERRGTGKVNWEFLAEAGQLTTPTAYQCATRFIVQMRVPPTWSVTGTVSDIQLVRGGATVDLISIVGTDNANGRTILLSGTCAATGGSAGEQVRIQTKVIGTWLNFDAEL